jgi:hypothetical protein
MQLLGRQEFRRATWICTSIAIAIYRRNKQSRNKDAAFWAIWLPHVATSCYLGQCEGHNGTECNSDSQWVCEYQKMTAWALFSIYPTTDRNCAPYTYIFRFTTFYTSPETPDELGHATSIPLNIPKQNKLIPLRWSSVWEHDPAENYSPWRTRCFAVSNNLEKKLLTLGTFWH